MLHAVTGETKCFSRPCKLLFLGHRNLINKITKTTVSDKHCIQTHFFIELDISYASQSVCWLANEPSSSIKNAFEYNVYNHCLCYFLVQDPCYFGVLEVNFPPCLCKILQLASISVNCLSYFFCPLSAGETYMYRFCINYCCSNVENLEKENLAEFSYLMI